MIKRNKRNILLVISSTFLASTTIGKSAWIVRHDDAFKDDVGPSSTAEVETCYTLSDKQRYTSIEKGLSVANSRNGETLVVSANATIHSSVSVASGTTLLIPYNSQLSEKEFIVRSDDVPISRKFIVTLSGNSTLTIDKGGKFVVAAQIDTKAISGAYSEFSLDKGSKILVNGECFIYGKITETNAVYGYDKAVYDNSLDAGRYLQVNSDGMVTTSFASYDISGSGSALNNQINANICPTYNFDFPCIQTYAKFLFGSKLDAVAYVTTASGNKDATAGLIGPSGNSSDKRLFYITEGEVDIEYCGSKKTTIYINGKIKVGSLYIDASVVTVDTSKMYLPFGSYLKIYVDGEFDTNSNDIKFLPGSYLKILDGSSFKINGTSSHKSHVIVYNNTSLTSIGIEKYGKESPAFINNGEIVLNEYGGIAGYVTTEKTDGSSHIDLSKVSDAAMLNLQTSEGLKGEKTIPSVRFYGQFFEQDISSASYAFFNPGLNYSSYIGDALWDGENKPAVMVSISVPNLKLTDFSQEAFIYSVSTTDNASGANEVVSFSKITEERNQLFPVEKNKYLKIVDDYLCCDISVNGSSYTSGELVQTENDIKVIITPSPAYLVKCRPINAKSGAGTFSRSISYGKTSGSMNFKVSTSAGEAIQAVVPKGWSFSVADGSNYPSGSSSKINKIVYSENHTTETSTIASKSKGQAWKDSDVFTSNADYDFILDGIGGCFASGTPILMEDGSYKNIEDITYADRIMTWNFFTGKFEAQPIAILVDHGEEIYKTAELEFSDGSKITIIADHGFFDYDKNEFVYLTPETAERFLHHKFVSMQGESFGMVELTNVTVTEKRTHAYSLTSAFNYNAIANKLLTCPPPGEFYNWVSMGDKLRYDTISFEADVKRYGLYDYSVFEPYGITYETFIAFNGQYLKIPIEKGIFDFDYIINLFNMYKGWIE